MKKLWDLKKGETHKLKKEFYKTDYAKYLLKDIIGGFISIIFIMFISGILYEFDKFLSYILMGASLIITFFVILEYFRVEYILFEKYLVDRKIDKDL